MRVLFVHIPISTYIPLALVVGIGDPELIDKWLFFLNSAWAERLKNDPAGRKEVVPKSFANVDLRPFERLRGIASLLSERPKLSLFNRYF